MGVRGALEVAGMRRGLLILAVTVCVATAASSAYAHHSHPIFYDQCRRVTIEGRVERVEFKDPHSQIFLRTDDGTAYTVDWATLRNLTNNLILGPAKEALVVGARVSVMGNPIRTAAQIRELVPNFSGVVNPNTIDLLSIGRVGDGSSWEVSRNRNPIPPIRPDCATFFRTAESGVVMPAR
jgi:hypothetical protein